MGDLLKGKPVADKLTELNIAKAEELRAKGITPTLAIVRVGANPGDLYYEKGALKRADQTGVDVKQFIYDEAISQEELIGEIEKINRDDSIHGVLLFRPLPKHMDDYAVCQSLAPAKDLDGITSGSMAKIFTGSGSGYPPCTAAACMAILENSGVDLKGRKVTIMGRSLVIGRPVAMMCMEQNATVTICHSRTTPEDFADAGRGADVVIAALGKAKMVKADMLGEGQIIIDVGINEDEDGKMCGDVDFQQVEGKAEAITPVPGGVGSVTTAILMKHLLEAADKTGQSAV